MHPSTRDKWVLGYSDPAQSVDAETGSLIKPDSFCREFSRSCEGLDAAKNDAIIAIKSRKNSVANQSYDGGGYGRDGAEFTRHRELSRMRFGRRAAGRRIGDRPVRRQDANCNARSLRQAMPAGPRRNKRARAPRQWHGEH